MDNNNETLDQAPHDVLPVTEPAATADTPMTRSRSMTGVVVIAAALIILLLTTRDTPKGAVVTEVPGEGEQTVCYYGVTPTASGFDDVYSLKLMIGGTNATGELATAPAEKDRMKGTLSGTVTSTEEGYLFDGTYANSAEGMDNVDQRIIRLTPTSASIGYGETVQNADGSYSYKDAQALDYSLSLPRVDCADYASAY